MDLLVRARTKTENLSGATQTTAMIGLMKKKQEAEAAAAAEAAEAAAEEAAAAAGASSSASADSAAGENGADAAGVAGTDGAKAGGRGRGRGRGSVNIFGVKGANKTKKPTGRRMRPGEIRVQKDISELDGGACIRAVFPNPNDLMSFQVIVTPDDGYWKGFEWPFQIDIPDLYPHTPPKVKCLQKVYHPNIDVQGNVCLNILRADWKPVLSVNAVNYGLLLLFVEPNGDDPLNHAAAEVLRTNPAKFKQNVQRALQGYSVDGEEYPPAIKEGTKTA